jgi:hypothetical protein
MLGMLEWLFFSVFLPWGFIGICGIVFSNIAISSGVGDKKDENLYTSAGVILGLVICFNTVWAW